MAADNKTLGRFSDWYPSCTSWYPTNRSNFRHRWSSIVSVGPKTAELKRTNNCYQSNSGLTDEEIVAWWKDARKPNAEKDKKRKKSRPSWQRFDQAISRLKRQSRKLKVKASCRMWCCTKAALDEQESPKTTTPEGNESKTKHWTKKLKDLPLNSTNKPPAAQQTQAGAEGAQATGNAGDDVCERRVYGEVDDIRFYK